MDPATTLIISTTAKEIIKLTAGKAFDYITSKSGLVRLPGSKDKYLEHCEKVLSIKTLASQDNFVFVDDIYVPLTLKSTNLGSVTVGNSTTLDVEHRVVLIKGLAGQGKSTILRKLVGNNLRRVGCFPIFYELKNYKGGDIEDSLSESMKIYGVEFDRVYIEKILCDSYTKIYLDAFDEVHPEHINSLLDQIGKLINRYMCHVVCTTRPDTQLDTLSGLATYTVDVLNKKQISDIIHRTSSDKEKAVELCAALDRSPLHNGKESILKWPILVVLYCISYNLGEEIPDALSQFYFNIFDTIFFRHDNLKGKVDRSRTFNDDKSIYRKLFNCLCFASQKDGASNFNRDELIRYIEHSMKYLSKDESLSDKICDDFIQITNLIIQDGYNEYRFIHKSIQEFFSASFIQYFESKTKFYEKCSNDYSFYSTFSGTLFFLEEIDYYPYCENYYIPAVSDLLNLNNKELSDDFEVADALVDTFIDCMVINVKHERLYNKQLKTHSETIDTSEPKMKNPSSYQELYARLFNKTVELLCVNCNEELGRIVMKKGTCSTDGDYSAAFAEIMPEIGISKTSIKSHLRTGVYLLFRDKYNNALAHTANRRKVISSEGPFIM